MIYEIHHANIEDRQSIYQLYDDAISYQLQNDLPAWNGYSSDLIEQEIEDLSLYKITTDNRLAAIFSAGGAGSLEIELWKERTNDRALYLNRIIAGRKFKGQRLFGLIIDWARTYCLARQYKFIRLDTWSDNLRLIEYYSSYGFRNLGVVQTSNSALLPLQYHGLKLLIMEKDI